MNKATSNTAILSISLDRKSKLSLQTQLVKAFRDMVHEQRLRPGDRLPSSRTLAQETSVSRITVSAAYDKLMAEGYLTSYRGSGVYVADNLPDLPNLPVGNDHNTDLDWGQLIDRSRSPVPFETGVPDLREFPFREWGRVFSQTWRTLGASLMMIPDPFGWMPLRSAIAIHLRNWRGILCDPSQIVITSGLVESVELVSNAALIAGSMVLVEDPGHQVLRKAFINQGHHCEPISVDEHGFAPDRTRKFDSAAAIAVTPSCQFPLGMTMPLARRLELLNWANKYQGIIFEDDYDGEFRYQGQPIPAMMSLDSNERVVYVGSFSKVMMPSLRIGFMVVPKSLTRPVCEVMIEVGVRASFIMQPTLAKFIADGGFSTHVRRMRRLYGARQNALVSAIQEEAGDVLRIRSAPGGMHLIARIQKGPSAETIAARAQEKGVLVRPLSSYFSGRQDDDGIVLGYAGFNVDEIQSSVKTLASVLRSWR